MRDFYTANEHRAAEAPLLEALPESTLMRRASYGLAVHVVAQLRSSTGGVAGRRVTVLVGSGNNGGDGLWAGAFLRRRGVRVTAVLLDPSRAHAAGLAALRRAGGVISADLADTSAVSNADLIVDAIIGISGRGSLRPAAAALVAAIDAPVVAVDVPSGVDPQTGVVDGPCVRADVTVALGALSPVHVLAVPLCGRVELVSIGLGATPASIQALDLDDVADLWPIPSATDDKYSQGVVGIAAGSAQYPGAAILCSGAAVAATSGMVRFVGTAAQQVVSHYPEVVAAETLDAVGRVQAWVVGPGFGTDDAARRVLEKILDSDVPVLVDADALTLVSTSSSCVTNRRAPTLLTPHAGEFQRLTGADPSSDRVSAVRELAAKWSLTVLLKGRATVIADRHGRVLISDAGGSAASTAGSGDALAGIVGALLAAGIEPLLAAGAGARVHSLAAERASTGSVAGSAAPTSASPLVAHISEAIRSVRATTLPH